MPQTSTKELADYELRTVNVIAQMTGGNYRTVRRILLEMLANNQITEGTVTKNNRIVPAYYTNNSTIKAVQAELQEIRHRNKQVVAPTITNSNTNENKVNNNNDVAQATNTNDNVTVYEVMNLQKRNNELENQIVKLQLSIKDLEIKNTRLDSEVRVKDKDILLITDKSKEIEKNYFEKVQEVQNLQGQLKRKNNLLLVLNAVILIVVTIIGTITILNILK